MIEKHCIGWTKNRLSRVAVSVLRTAVYEMLYEEKIRQRFHQRGGGVGQKIRRRRGFLFRQRRARLRRQKLPRRMTQ